MSRAPTLRAARECSRCGTIHQRKHSWCLTCSRERDREANARDPRTGFQRVTEGWQPSKAPAPPPGFDPRDRTIGRPHG